MKHFLILVFAFLFFSCSDKKNNETGKSKEKGIDNLKKKEWANWTAKDDSVAKNDCIEKMMREDYSLQEAGDICSCILENGKQIFSSYSEMKAPKLSKEQEKKWKEVRDECGIEEDEDEQ